MNTQQLTELKAAINTDRKNQIAVLKAVRAAGVKLAIDLRASTRAIADEISRLLRLAVEGVKSVVKVAETVSKATLAYWVGSPVKALNSRGVKGAIALSLNLGL